MEEAVRVFAGRFTDMDRTLYKRRELLRHLNATKDSAIVLTDDVYSRNSALGAAKSSNSSLDQQGTGELI
jgi:hypothetical protein